MIDRITRKIKVLGDGPPFEVTPKQIRCYVEDLFEEDFGFRLYLQESVVNGEFHLLLRRANKLWLNDEQLRVVNSIYCYLPNSANQSKINIKHTDNLANALGIQLI